MAKQMMPMYLILLGFAILSKLGSLLASHFPIVSPVTTFLTGLFILLLVGIFIATFVVAVYHFYRNFIKDEGYLTHTLPVTKNQLVLSKLMSALVYIIVTVLVVGIALLIAFYQKDALLGLWKLWETGLETQFHIHPVLGAVVFAVLMLVSYIYQLLLVYLAIALGQTKNGNRALNSIAYGFVLYIVNQVISVATLLLSMVFKPDLLKQFEQSVPDVQSIGIVFSISFLISIVISIIYYIVTVRLLDKKLNLE